jgi:tartrate dehydrogenase/decarboxylase/D-malate dehydrogenase
MEAIEVITANPDFHTPDLGGAATSEQVTNAIIDVIRARNE